MGTLKLGLHQVEVDPVLKALDYTKTQRVARSASGDRGIYIQGLDKSRFDVPAFIRDGDQTGLAQIESIEDEVGRFYPILASSDFLVRSDNTTGRVFLTLDSINSNIPSPMSSSKMCYQAQIRGIIAGTWAEYRRCRWFRNVDVTTNYFGLPGAYEVPLPPLDGSLTFNGSTQCTELSSGVSSDLNITSIFESEVWLNQTANTGRQQLHAKNTGGASYNFGLDLTAGYPVFRYTSVGPIAHVYTTTTNPVVAGANAHVFCTFNFGTGSTMTIYVNGQPCVGSWTSGDGNAAPLTAADRFCIGAVNVLTDFYFNGKIWDVKIANPSSQTSAANVLLSYRRGRSLLDSTTKGLWRLNEWTGTTNYDSTGLNDLAMVNTPTFTGGYLNGATPSETIDLFRRTSYGIIPVVSAPDLACVEFDTHDYDLTQDQISVTRSGKEWIVHNGLIRLRTRHDESTNKGRLDVSYWDKSAWSTVQTSCLYGEVKSSAGSTESFTDSSVPSVFIKKGQKGEYARLVLAYPSTTSGYTVKLAHVIKRGSPVIKTELYSAGTTLASARLNLNLQGTAFTQQTQLGATTAANSGALGTPQVSAGDSDSNVYNYVHTADPWATTAVAAGFIRAKKADCNYITDDAGTSFDYVGLEFDNVVIEENQPFATFWWFMGRYDCINTSVGNLAQIALRDIAAEDDINQVA